MYIEQTSLLIVLVLTLLVVLAVVGYFLYAMIRIQRNYLHLHELQNQARIAAMEKERRLVAADLHDDIGPILSAVTMKLGGIKPVNVWEEKLLDESIEHIDAIFNRVRKISYSLVPQSLQMSGPLYAIKEEFNSFYKDDPGLRVDVNPIRCPGLSMENALHLYRMLQEIIHNCIRHAKASQLSISGELTGRKLVIRTKDNGIGIDQKKIKGSTGVGLENISLRAQMIGAKLEMHSYPGEGTGYTIEILLPGEPV